MGDVSSQDFASRRVRAVGSRRRALLTQAEDRTPVVVTAEVG
ncbi:hypothetical protein [Streptomyces sp. NBC_01445]|nr:hypothetical protein [Streptomyces sp. NBC_01445]WSE02431.1 hypothetical protein OG574_02995 [Streptomyces sp. NBC_01445]